MTLSSLSTLMDQQVWKGKIFTGEWISSTGGEYQSIEPSTGTTLGVVGRASVEDVLRSAERAAEAQRAWASAPFDQRACCVALVNCGRNTQPIFSSGSFVSRDRLHPRQALNCMWRLLNVMRPRPWHRSPMDNSYGRKRPA